MKIARVAFIHPVQCAGSITSASAGKVVGDRPGQTPFEIDLVEIAGLPCVRISKHAAGKFFSTHVPIFNVGFFEPMTPEQLAAVAKKEAEDAATAKAAKDDVDARAKKANESKK